MTGPLLEPPAVTYPDAGPEDGYDGEAGVLLQPRHGLGPLLGGLAAHQELGAGAHPRLAWVMASSPYQPLDSHCCCDKSATLRHVSNV